MSLLALNKLYIVNIMCYESEDKTMKNTARTFTTEDIAKVGQLPTLGLIPLQNVGGNGKEDRKSRKE